MKVTPIIVLVIWSTCIAFSITITFFWPWQTLYLHTVTFAALIAPLIILHAKGQNQLIERLKTNHAEEWRRFTANRSYSDLRKFYKNDEFFGDEKLRLLKTNYKRIFILSIILMGASIASSLAFAISK